MSFWESAQHKTALLCSKGYLEGFEFTAGTNCAAKQSTAVCHHPVSDTSTVEQKWKQGEGCSCCLSKLARKQMSICACAWILKSDTISTSISAISKCRQAGEWSLLYGASLLVLVPVNLLPSLVVFLLWVTQASRVWLVSSLLWLARGPSLCYLLWNMF